MPNYCVLLQPPSFQKCETLGVNRCEPKETCTTTYAMECLPSDKFKPAIYGYQKEHCDYRPKKTCRKVSHSMENMQNVVDGRLLPVIVTADNYHTCTKGGLGWFKPTPPKKKSHFWKNQPNFRTPAASHLLCLKSCVDSEYYSTHT